MFLGKDNPRRAQRTAAFFCLLFLFTLGVLLWRQIPEVWLRVFVCLSLAMAGSFPLALIFEGESRERGGHGTPLDGDTTEETAGNSREMKVIVGGLHTITREFRSTAKELENLVEKFSTLTDLTEITSRISDINELLKLVLQKGMGATGSRIGTVMMLREEGDGLEIVATEGWTPNFMGPIDPSETLAGRVIESGEPLLVSDIKDSLQRSNDTSRYNHDSFLIMPLKARTKTVGAVCLSEKIGGEPYTHEDQKFMNVLLSQVGFAIENARLLKQARESAQKLTEVVEKQQHQIAQARQQIFHAEKLSSMGQMIAGVAHELNNPLTSILGYAELLLDKEDDPKKKKKLNTIFNETKRARKIVENLLLFARDRKVEKGIVNLNQIVENIVALRQYDLGNRGIDLSADLESDLPDTVADADHIQQVLLNLVNNSVQAMPAQGLRQVRIGTEKGEDGKVRLWVADTGKGIPEKDLERIFEPFYSTKPGTLNTGLGLTLSREIIREHGGDMLVESKEGRGTRITIELPIIDAPAKEIKTVSEAIPDFHEVDNMAALVVDDEEPNAELVAEILDLAGFRTEVTTSGEQALQYLLHQPFDLVVCDVLMPRLDGKQLYREVLKRKPDTAKKFVFITGDIADPRTYLFAENNGVRLVTKPFIKSELLNAAYEKLAPPAA